MSETSAGGWQEYGEQLTMDLVSRRKVLDLKGRGTIRRKMLHGKVQLHKHDMKAQCYFYQRATEVSALACV